MAVKSVDESSFYTTLPSPLTNVVISFAVHKVHYILYISDPYLRDIVGPLYTVNRYLGTLPYGTYLGLVYPVSQSLGRVAACVIIS